MRVCDLQIQDGQHYVVLEVIQSSSSPNGRGPNVFFFRTAVGRKLLEILEIGTVGRVKLERQKTAPTQGPVYGVRIHIMK